MEKKKLKLSISGSSQKTLSSIEQAKSKSKNTVVIEKKSSKFVGKSQFSRQNNNNFKPSNNVQKTNNFSRISTQPSSDFEKRKLAEQRATRRLKGEAPQKDNKSSKIGGKRRELKLTVSRALSDDHSETKSRSLASLKRAKQKENRSLNQNEEEDNFKQIKREVNLPEVITIKELANRMAEQSSLVIIQREKQKLKK
jgi:translation initiation factor IF-2